MFGYKFACQYCGIGFIEDHGHCSQCGRYVHDKDGCFKIPKDKPGTVIKALKESIESKDFQEVPFGTVVHALRMQRAIEMIDKLSSERDALVSALSNVCIPITDTSKIEDKLLRMVIENNMRYARDIIKRMEEEE
jgi:uncharacterized membrane protein YvbJ